MTAETVIIKMTRLDCTVPWGFRLQGGKDYMSPMIINRIIQGGLAENSGLREGDFLIEILNKSTDQMNHSDAQTLIMSCGNDLEMKVERTSARIWSPLIKPVAVKPGDQNGAPVKYSLAHGHSQQMNSNSNKSTTGYNTSVRTLVIDGPSAPKQSENTQELKKEMEEPAYLKSETLKLINESEKNNKTSSADISTNLVKKHDEAFDSGSGTHGATLPQCQHCGRYIQGMFCKASGKHLHSECFVCTTCGSNLKNKGYYVIGSKFYCDIHAKQLSQDQFKATPPIDPNLFYSRAPPLDVSPLRTEPIKAPYQPEILKRGEFLHAPKATSLSPSSRGIPTYSPKAKGYFRVPEAHELELAGYPTLRGASPTHLLTPMNNLAVSGEQRSNEVCRKPTESLEKYSAKLPCGQSFTSNGPKRGKGSIQHPREGSRVAFCKVCSRDIRGPFVLAFSDCFCPEHFVCSVDSCRKRMLDVGFVDVQGDGGKLCCENCYEKFFAPQCHHCSRPVTKECMNALQHQWHPECFKCAKCQQTIGTNVFFNQNGSIFCEKDWNQLFTAKCIKCQFPIETGDRYVEALGDSYHADCFTCTACNGSLEGRSFYGKGGKPFCEKHV